MRLYEKGLIYRGDHIVNWCPLDQTAISGRGSRVRRARGKLLLVKYASGSWRTSSSPRRARKPCWETPRVRGESRTTPTRQHLVGQDLRGSARRIARSRSLPTTAVQQDFGSGFVKVTPAHDPADFGIGQRHNMSRWWLIDREGRMTDSGREGLRRARSLRGAQEVIEAPRTVPTAGQGRAVSPQRRHRTTAAARWSSRCSRTQWFVKMKPLAGARAFAAVESDEITFVPADAGATSTIDWMTQHPRLVHLAAAVVGPPHPGLVLRRRPRSRSRATIRPRVRHAARTPSSRRTTTCSTRGSRSWLWPFSTLGWPDETRDLRALLPDRRVLVTGYDIIFFWVARMIMAALEFMRRGPVPARLPDRHRARRSGPQDEQVARQFARPARHHRQVGDGRVSLHAVDALAAGARTCSSTKKARASGRNFTQQDLAGIAPRDECCGGGKTKPLAVVRPDDAGGRHGRLQHASGVMPRDIAGVRSRSRAASRPRAAADAQSLFRRAGASTMWRRASTISSGTTSVTGTSSWPRFVLRRRRSSHSASR